MFPRNRTLSLKLCLLASYLILCRSVSSSVSVIGIVGTLMGTLIKQFALTKQVKTIIVHSKHRKTKRRQSNQSSTSRSHTADPEHSGDPRQPEPRNTKRTKERRVAETSLCPADTGPAKTRRLGSGLAEHNAKRAADNAGGRGAQPEPEPCGRFQGSKQESRRRSNSVPIPVPPK